MKRWIAIALISLVACTPASRFSQYNAAVIYQGDAPESLPEYRIYHTDEARSQVYFSIPANNLLYISKNEGAYTARVKLSWEVVPSLDDLTILDSGSVVLEDQRPQPEVGEIFGYLKINSACPPHVNRILLLLTLSDLNRKNTQTRMLEISRINHQDKQYFLLTDTAGHPLMNDYIRPNFPYKIKHFKSASLTYHIRHYNRPFPVAEPPYSEDVIKSFQYKADSTFTLHSDSAVLFDQPGFYHVQIHDSIRTGLTLFGFPKGYPDVYTARAMGESLRYLTTQKEYEQLTKGNPDSIRRAVEYFWLKAAGNPERARVAIREYYSRIEMANHFFTSYVEGWKTDRGMVFTIYGPPNIVYQTPVGETWIYGAENSILPYQFKFIRVDNPFSNNDFELTRLSSTRYGWSRAMESWRSGRPYSSRDIKREQDEREQQDRLQQRPGFWY